MGFNFINFYTKTIGRNNDVSNQTVNCNIKDLFLPVIVFPTRHNTSCNLRNKTKNCNF